MKIVSICDGASVIGLVSKELGLDHVVAFERSPFTHKLLSPNTQVIQELEEWALNGCFLNLDFDILHFRSPKMKHLINKESEHDNLYINQFCKILDRKKPKWFVWEAHPRIILGDNGNQLKRIIGEITAIGYGISWRVLDSQFFNSPIKSEKVYLVGHFGSWEETREVLFEEGSSLGEFEIKTKKRKKPKLQDIHESERIRQLTPVELERAFNLPDNYTKKIDHEQRIKVIKNSSNYLILKTLIKRTADIKYKN